MIEIIRLITYAVGIFCIIFSSTVLATWKYQREFERKANAEVCYGLMIVLVFMMLLIMLLMI